MRQPGRALVQGRKKGGGGSEAPDTLRSTQIAEVVLLVSEGEAQGLVNGLKSVYLDKVPLENPDGSKNFDDASFSYVTGAPGQAPLPGVGAVQNEIAVGLQVNQATPLVRTITNPAIDHVRVTIFVPQLTDLDVSNGNLNGSWFEWAVDVQSAGGGYVQRHLERIEGKTTQGYSRGVRIELTGSAPWDVRVRRITATPPSNIQSNFVWSTYTEIQSIRLRYQNSAAAVLRVSAKAFGKVPTIALDWLGQRVQLPSNYNPVTRAYTGTWDGTFSEGWTSNPAWVLYDPITHERYGAGRWVDPSIASKWSLYAIGQYCDVAVSDGRGGTEPRFTCNLNLETREEAFKVFRDIAAIFRGMVFWASSQIEFAQDAPSDPVHTFTPANVIDGRFTYADVSEKTRHSVFICWWNDLGQFGKRVPEIYVDETLVARYGLRELELAPLGLTSRGQAARACRWARHSEQAEGDLVSFEVGSDGIAVGPGRVFKIADPNEQGERLGGRVHAATTTVVTLDAPVTLAPGETYTLTVLQPDAADPVKLKPESRTVTTAAGTTSTITVASAFSAAPLAETVWLLESTAIGATLWRCLGVEEVKGKNRFKVTGLAHNPGKYAAIESGITLDERPVSRLTVVPPRPASVAVAETPYLVGTEYRSKVTISWPEPARGLLYRVGWRQAFGPWTIMPDTPANAVDVDNLPGGNFDCWVQSVNSLGNVSTLREATTVALLGKTAPPSNVSGAAQLVVQGGVQLSWLAAPDFDYLTTEIRIGASWVAGATLFEGAASGYLWAWPALGTYTLWFKHWDTSLNESATEISMVVVVDSATRIQWSGVVGRPKLFRAVARGESDTNAPVAAGLYDGESGALLTSSARSYIVNVIRRSDGAVIGGNVYDVYAGGSAMANMAAYLNSQNNTSIVCVRSYDEPFTNRLDANLLAAMKRCGASSAVFGSPLFRVRSAYVLLGIPGCGEGQGYEAYNGDVDADTNAWCDVSFYLQNGNLVVTGSGSTPRTLRDYSYTGDLDATRDISLVAGGNAILRGNTATKAGGVNAWDSQVYSRDGYTGGAFVSFVMPAPTNDFMVGLNTDPTTDASYASIDFALYGVSDGTMRVYESGVSYTVAGTYAGGEVATVLYDGYRVRYMLAGIVLRDVVVGPGIKLFADSSLATPGVVIGNIRFGPMSGVGGFVTRQAEPNAWTVPLTATFNGPVLLTGLGDGTPFTLSSLCALSWTNNTGEAQQIQLECYGECVRENATFVVFMGILVVSLTGLPDDERTVVFANADSVVRVNNTAAWLTQITVPAGSTIATKFRLVASGTSANTGSATYKNFSNRLTGVLR